ncbi:MAG: SDR family NAD(P)-dependent oxidoreductase [Melioribacteraceae bacterium]|nr:SDR family NAD(P)-dependent oxidoreductase [Melioribacteraceae bacterium]MCF8265024.1 SDR family NAD(P)-dependent oxidoreductase [Melioribacteraceae bacterium]MCF8413813.1 SDR family NAD(P)-dependent oxidoreductase [Melioribacteraceae bacterium]
MKKKVFVVTGASSGIGKSICKNLLDNGITVIGIARNKGRLDNLKKEFKHFGDQFKALEIDLSNFADMESKFNELQNSVSIIGVVNNAGITSFQSARETTAKETIDIININLLGAIITIKSSLESLIENKGILINILSVAATKIFTNSSVYAASKAGLLAYTNVLREELREKSVRIINILPGATKTPIWPNDALEKFSERMMDPVDIADIVYSVISNRKNIVQEEIVLRPIKGDL